MLSLSPRYDLFRFSLPKDFLPEEIESKYSKVVRSNQSVITTPIDYLNESIQGVSFPGIADVIVTQGQQGSNDISRKNRKTNFEPKMNMIYQTPENVLDKIDRSFKVTFRMNQGFYNYFMVYETLFHQVCKPLDRGHQPVYYIELLNEVGEITARILFKNVLIDGIDGLEFNFNKIERDSGTFDVNFKFANIDFEFVDKL